MRILWVAGVGLGLVVGTLVLSDVPLLAKFLVGLVVIVVGVAGPFGSVLLAGLLLGAGILTFLVLLLTSDAAAVSSSLGVATLLVASGVAISFRELFRDRSKPSSASVETEPDGRT